MPFCGKCGSRVNDTDKFCSKCGAFRKGILESKDNTNDYMSATRSCPNCGAVVTNTFQTNCSFCGFELLKDNIGSTVSDLAKRLDELEIQRNAGNLDESSNIYAINSEKISIAKANLISTFVIPNNLEDILEFMILSSSNIIPGYIAENSYSKDRDQIKKMSREQNAWYSKMEQAYNKAKISFGSEPLFGEVERIFIEKKLEIENEKAEKNKKDKNGVIIGLFMMLGSIGLMMIMFILGLILDK